MPLPPGGPVLEIDAFPIGLGRGYPVANLSGLAGRATSLEVGAFAPNFRLVLTDGSALTLADLRGRPVLLNFWASWCGPCRMELPDILKQAKEHDGDLVVIAVNVEESLDAIAPFAAEYSMQIPVLVDEEGQVVNLYQVRSMPTSYFIDRQGVISARWIGFMATEILDDLLSRIL